MWWSPEIRQDLLWWLDREWLELGILLEQVSPQLDLWSDASDVGWGAHLSVEVVSGLWSPEGQLSSINHRELLAIFYALQHFLPLVQNSAVAVYADNTTALAYLRNQGGTRSAVLNRTAQDLLRWAERHSISLLPQFIMGRNNVLADSLSRPNQILGSEWTLKLSVFQQLRRRWPVSIDMFATSLNHRRLPYFSPFHDPNALGTDALLQPWNGWQAYAFPPYALIPAILKKLLSSSGVLLTIIAPYWPPEALISGASGACSGRSGGFASGQGSVEPASCSSTASGSVKASSSCLETIQRFIRSRGFSRHVAKQAVMVRRPSSRAGYQAKWSIYRRWCTSEGHSISRPFLSKIVDFLFWLRRSKKLSVSAVMGYRSMLSAVFRSVLPEISTSPVLHDLLRSFRVEAPARSVIPPSWDLLKVLEYLNP